MESRACFFLREVKTSIFGTSISHFLVCCGSGQKFSNVKNFLLLSGMKQLNIAHIGSLWNKPSVCSWAIYRDTLKLSFHLFYSLILLKTIHCTDSSLLNIVLLFKFGCFINAGGKISEFSD